MPKITNFFVRNDDNTMFTTMEPQLHYISKIALKIQKLTEIFVRLFSKISAENRYFDDVS